MKNKNKIKTLILFSWAWLRPHQRRSRPSFEDTIFALLRSSSDISGNSFGDTGAPSHCLNQLKRTAAATKLWFLEIPALLCEQIFLALSCALTVEKLFFYRGISLKRAFFLWALNGPLWVVFTGCTIIIIPPTEIVLDGAAYYQLFVIKSRGDIIPVFPLPIFPPQAELGPIKTKRIFYL